LGKTAGRGHNGAKSRSGWGGMLGHEGGQMPIIRRLPKKGFNNIAFRTEYAILNVRDLEELFEVTDEVSPEAAKARGAMKKRETLLKILGKGELNKALTVQAHRFSASAREKIEKAGGTVVEIK
jgi:large subunit ribosomal protein L15